MLFPWQGSWNTSAIQQLLERWKHISPASWHTAIIALWLPECHRHLVGMIGIHLGRYYEKNGVYGKIAVLVVEPEHQGQHIGSALVRVLDHAPPSQILSALASIPDAHREGADLPPSCVVAPPSLISALCGNVPAKCENEH